MNNHPSHPSSSSSSTSLSLNQASQSKPDMPSPSSSSSSVASVLVPSSVAEPTSMVSSAAPTSSSVATSSSHLSSGAKTAEEELLRHAMDTQKFVDSWETAEESQKRQLASLPPAEKDLDPKVDAVPLSHIDAQSWFYKDPQNEIQGPFSSSEMTEWFQAGYFNMTLMVKRGCDSTLLPLGDLIKRWDRVPFTPGPPIPPIILHRNSVTAGNVDAKLPPNSISLPNTSSVPPPPIAPIAHPSSQQPSHNHTPGMPFSSNGSQTSIPPIGQQHQQQQQQLYYQMHQQQQLMVTQQLVLRSLLQQASVASAQCQQQVLANPAGAQTATASFQHHIRQIIQQMMELQFWRQMPQEQQQRHVLALQHLVQNTLNAASGVPAQQPYQQQHAMDALINAHTNSLAAAASSQQTPPVLRASPASSAQTGETASHSPHLQQQQPTPQRSDSVPFSENLTPYEKLVQANAHSISPSLTGSRSSPSTATPPAPKSIWDMGSSRSDSGDLHLMQQQQQPQQPRQQP